MPLTVKGTKEDRALVQGWLQQICSTAHVDPDTGKVDFTSPVPAAPAKAYTSGCDCLKELAKADGRTVTIQPLDAETSAVPGTGRPPRPQVSGDKGIPDVKIGDAHGGVTTYDNDNANGTAANPGKDSGGKVGTDSTTYIDKSNNGGKGYTEDGKTPGLKKGDPAPLWLILAHELTSGHAYHNAKGTRDVSKRGASERQALISENAHRAEHDMSKINLGGG